TRTGDNRMLGGEVRIDTAFGPEPDLGLAVRLGLASVRGLGKDAAERVVAARGAPEEGRAFSDLRGLVRRVDLTAAQLEGLATAGATDGLGVTRREALWAAGALAQEGPGTLPGVSVGVEARSEERRVGKERRSRERPPHREDADTNGWDVGARGRVRAVGAVGAAT